MTSVLTRLRGLGRRAQDRAMDAAPDLLTGGGLQSLVGGHEPGEVIDDGDGETAAPRERKRARRPRRRSRSSDPPTTVILPRPPGVFRRISEFWRYRRATTYFGRAALFKLYRRTWLGWLWVPLRPTVGIATQVMVFGSIIGAPSGNIPYFLFLLVGSTVWDLFAMGCIWGARSLQLGSGTLRRIYIPRLTCLVGGLAPAFVYAVIYVITGVIAVLFYLLTDGTTHLHIGPKTLLAPLGASLAVLLALSLSCFTSVIVMRARDVRFALTYAMGTWFFITPVIYPLSEAPGGLQTAISLNPMTAPVEMVRIGLFDYGHLTPVCLASCAVGLLVIGIPGLIFFNRSEAASLDAM
jgi:lipopolysaccharide transport system permease protein